MPTLSESAFFHHHPCDEGFFAQALWLSAFGVKKKTMKWLILIKQIFGLGTLLDIDVNIPNHKVE